MASLLFIIAYDKTFFNMHFHWLKHVDPLAKANGFLSRHMAVHSFVMIRDLKELQQNWKINEEFVPFQSFVAQEIQDQNQIRLLLHSMPKVFFDVAIKSFHKHFDQWRSERLLPLAIAGDETPAKALADFFINGNINGEVFPTSYDSVVHKTSINLKRLLEWLTETLPINCNFRNRIFFRRHSSAIEEMKEGKGLWVRDASVHMKKLRTYIENTYLPLPSNNQIVEAGVKDTALCRTTSKGERMASILVFYRSITVPEAVEDSIVEKMNANNGLEQYVDRGKKRVESMIVRSIDSSKKTHLSDDRRKMKENLDQKNSYVKSCIATKVERFQRLSSREKRPNQTQQVRGIEFQPLILGKISYGQLKKEHITMVRNELSTREVHYNVNTGIRALTKLLREHESALVGHDTKYFLPQTATGEDWFR